MKNFYLAVSNHVYVVRAIPGGNVPDLGIALEVLRARPDSVTHTLSVEFPNFMCRPRAEALAIELETAGFSAAADAIARAMVEAGELDDVVLSPAP